MSLSLSQLAHYFNVDVPLIGMSCHTAIAVVRFVGLPMLREKIHRIHYALTPEEKNSR